MKIKKIFFIILGLFLIFGFFDFSNAGFLPSGWWDPYKETMSDLKFVEGTLQQQVGKYLENFLSLARSLLLIAGVVFGTVSMIRLSLSGEDSEITSAKNKFTYIVIGFVILSIPELVGDAMNPVLHGKEIASKEKFRAIVDLFIDYFSLIAGAIAIFLLFISAFGILSSPDDKDGISKYKNKFINSAIALIAIVYLRVFVYDVIYKDYGKGGINDLNGDISKQIFDFVSWALGFFGLIGIGFAILAGTYMFFSGILGSGNDKAKNIFTNLLYGIIIIISSYSIVLFFVPK